MAIGAAFSQSNEVQSIPDDAPPVGQIAKVLNRLIYAENSFAATTNTTQFLNDVAAINAARCPQDFQDDWRKFVRCFIEIQTHQNALADLLAFVAALHGDTGNASNSITRRQDLQASILELKSTCAQYGIDACHALPCN